MVEMRCGRGAWSVSASGHLMLSCLFGYMASEHTSGPGWILIDLVASAESTSYHACMLTREGFAEEHCPGTKERLAGAKTQDVLWRSPRAVLQPALVHVLSVNPAVWFLEVEGVSFVITYLKHSAYGSVDTCSVH